MQQEKKSDSEIGTALKQVELSQELTRPAINRLVSYVPGPISTEQIYVLEARSADLFRPHPIAFDGGSRCVHSEDYPSKSDGLCEQKVLRSAGQLDCHQNYLAFSGQLRSGCPGFRLTRRSYDVVVSAGFSNPASFVHYINSSEARITSIRGVEKWPSEKDTRSASGREQDDRPERAGPDPDVFKEAESAESVRWLRWELINGKPVAVFSFVVPGRNPMWT